MHVARQSRWLAGIAVAAVAATSLSAMAGSASAAVSHPNKAAGAAKPSATVPADGGSLAAAGSHLVTLSLNSSAGAAGVSQIAALSAQALSPNGAVRAQQIRQRQSTLAALAPPASAFSTIKAFAAKHGLTVTYTTHWTVTLKGDPAVLAGLFGVTTHVVHYTKTGRARTTATGLAHTGTLAIPAELSNVANSAIGLDDRPMARPRTSTALKPAARVVAPHDVPLDPGGNTGPTYTAYLGGQKYATGTGAGVNVGIVSFDPNGISLDDAAQYNSDAGINPPVPVDGMAEAGISPFGTIGQEDVEGNLDVESLNAVAPAAQEIIYTVDSSGAAEAAMYSKMADDAAAGSLQMVSDSFGLCEEEEGTAFINALSPSFARVVAAGATFFAASGDSGAFDCSTSDSPSTDVQVDYPAADPAVVGVGGINAVPTTSANATAWGDPTEGSPNGPPAGSGGGGGTSSIFPIPAYQAGKPGIFGSTRNVPDISGPADPTNGFEERVNGAYGIVGGTSLAAPLTAGYTADALSLNNRAGLPASPGFGDIHAALYNNPTAFTDITAGNNLLYTAIPGYDLTTGLGVLNLQKYSDVLLGAPFADPVLTAPPITNTATINISSPSAGDRHFTGFRVTIGADSCATPPAAGGTIPATVTLPVTGNNTLTLVSEDELGNCHVTTTTVNYDPNYQPTPPVNPTPPPVPVSGDHTPPTIIDGAHALKNSQLADASFAVSDISGIAAFSGKVVNLDTGHTVLTVHTPGVYLFQAAGGHFAAEATATDGVGNKTGNVIGKAIANPGVDDRQLRKHGDWIEAHYGNTLDLTVSISGKPGSTLTAYKYRVGGHAQRVTVFSQGGNGTVQVIVDGKNFGAPIKMRHHDAIKLPSHLQPGTHTIALKLLSGVAIVDGLQVN